MAIPIGGFEEGKGGGGGGLSAPPPQISTEPP